MPKMLHIQDADIMHTTRMLDGKPTDSGGQSAREVVRVKMNDGHIHNVVREDGWTEKDFTTAQKLAASYIKGHRCTESDLATAFVSTGNNPGLQVIEQSKRVEGKYGGAICKTTDGVWLFWHDSKDEDDDNAE